MLSTRIIRSGFRTALTHKLRAFFMMLSVVIGIAVLTVVISLGKGTENQLMSRVRNLFSSNAIAIMSGNMKNPSMHSKMTASNTLKLSDIEDIARNAGNIAGWDASQMAVDRPVTYQGKRATAELIGEMPAAESVWNLALTEGRFISTSDNDGMSRVAVLAPDVQKELFESTDPVGKQVEIDGIPFRVIGTIGHRGLYPDGDNPDRQVMIPLQTMLKRVTNENYIMYAKLVVADKNDMASTAEQITQILRRRHGLNAHEKDDFMVITPHEIDVIIGRTEKAFNLYLPLLSFVFLIIGGIIVVNLMLLSVSERVKEIGLRKAVGARSKDILSQFLIEASSITLFGGIVGVFLGLLLLIPLTGIMHVPYAFSWGALLLCFASSTALGIAAGYVPARRAAAMQPAETLK